jgi:hypothetical protein
MKVKFLSTSLLLADRGNPTEREMKTVTTSTIFPYGRHFFSVVASAASPDAL